jgi:hypothetical protein
MKAVWVDNYRQGFSLWGTSSNVGSRRLCQRSLRWYLIQILRHSSLNKKCNCSLEKLDSNLQAKPLNDKINYLNSSDL